jgi:Methyltransferase domain
MFALYRLAIRGVKRHGAGGLALVAVERVWRHVSKLRPSVRRAIAEREQRAAAFDALMGVDTSGIIHPLDLDVVSENVVHAVSYRGSDPDSVMRALQMLEIEHRNFEFIDFGSGKGRVVLLAATFAFRRVVGVEFSEHLDRVARENLQRSRRDAFKCSDIHLVCGDAVHYRLPASSLVCYFCNPFGAAVMSQVLANVRQAYAADPRDIYIVYYNPKESQLLDGDAWFRRVGAVDSVCIWQAVRP